jgi:hypothetical protein
MTKYEGLAFEDTLDQRRKKRSTALTADFEALLELDEVVLEDDVPDWQVRKRRGKDWDDVAYSRRRKLHRRERRSGDDDA